MKQGDIYLVPFPFSDLSRTKVRPVVISSNNYFNKNSADAIVVPLTSISSSKCEKIDLRSLKEGSLHKICYVKHESLFKLDKKLLIKKIASLKPEIFSKVKKRILNLF